MKTIEELIKLSNDPMINNACLHSFTGRIMEESFINGYKYALGNQWISVKDKLPSNSQRCFIRFGDGTVIHSCYVGGYFMGDDDHDTKYWMPIPKLSNL